MTAAVQAAVRASGLSVNEIARRLSPDGNRRSQVQKWLRGETGITPQNAVLLEQALAVRAGTIVTVVRAEEARRAAERLEAEFAARREELRRRLSEDA